MLYPTVLLLRTLFLLLFCLTHPSLGARPPHLVDGLRDLPYNEQSRAGLFHSFNFCVSILLIPPYLDLFTSTFVEYATDGTTLDNNLLSYGYSLPTSSGQLPPVKYHLSHPPILTDLDSPITTPPPNSNIYNSHNY